MYIRTDARIIGFTDSILNLFHFSSRAFDLAIKTDISYVSNPKSITRAI